MFLSPRCQGLQIFRGPRKNRLPTGSSILQVRAGNHPDLQWWASRGGRFRDDDPLVWEAQLPVIFSDTSASDCWFHLWLGWPTYILSTVNVFDQRFGADTPNFYRTWREKFSFTAFWSVEVSVLPDTVPTMKQLQWPASKTFGFMCMKKYETKLAAVLHPSSLENYLCPFVVTRTIRSAGIFSALPHSHQCCVWVWTLGHVTSIFMDSAPIPSDPWAHNGS